MGDLVDFAAHYRRRHAERVRQRMKSTAARADLRARLVQPPPRIVLGDEQAHLGVVALRILEALNAPRPTVTVKEALAMLSESPFEGDSAGPDGA